MTQYETFLQLHHQSEPLLIGNVWDAVSAKVFEQKGFKAIATSSAALARTMGYEDGEQLPFDLLLTMVKGISSNISIPLSVDMEGGYSRSIPGIIDNIEKLYALGVVGINIEDSSKEHKGQLMPMEDFQSIISAIANHLSKNNIQLFINARTDAFVHKHTSAVEETVIRVKAYENAGASGIFVPFLHKEEDIQTIVAATQLPVNVFSMPQLPSFNRLAALGVRRISMGTAVHRAMAASLDKIIGRVREEQSFSSLYMQAQ